VLSHFALITVQVPEQIVTLLLIQSTGFGLTYTVAVAGALVQPFFVPCTVYTVVLPGDTVMQALVAPVFQVYVVRPAEAHSICEAPAQMVEVEGEILMVGSGVTFTCRVAVLTHPAALTAVTVYTVVTVGQAVVLPLNGDDKPVVGDQV
jgi:hypothetical protein